MTTAVLSSDLPADGVLGLAERAELTDGQRILELGCGWGSLTLWMAQRYPAARITAVSNSHGQRQHIEARCRALGLPNVAVLTEDVARLALGTDEYDRLRLHQIVRTHAQP